MSLSASHESDEHLLYKAGIMEAIHYRLTVITIMRKEKQTKSVSSVHVREVTIR